MTPDFKRKNIRLAAEDYRGRKFYFVTLCFESRSRFGANSRVASWLIARLQKRAASSGFFVRAYCVMPDHSHVLVCAASEESNLMVFVESFKQETAFEFAKRRQRNLWQFKYYDRILRASDSPDCVAWYIWLNPVRKGLCKTPLEYPFLGSFTEVGTRLLSGAAVRPWTPPWKREPIGKPKMPR
jgi:putative transposase